MRPLSTNVTYAEAKGQEQALMDFLGAKTKGGKRVGDGTGGDYPGNLYASWTKAREDDRAAAYRKAYMAKMVELTTLNSGKKCAG